jgi:uncharacterized RDD family membrane protein YckC
VRRAIAHQTAGLAEEVVAGARHAAVRLDGRVGRSPAAPVYAGIGTRAIALAVDVFLAMLIFVSLSAVVALIASLFGGIRPRWAAGALLGAGWVVVSFVYFTLFWSSAGQTLGMRLMRLRLRRPGGGQISVFRSIVRVVGLALAIIPFFAGFIPVLFDSRRRGLPDYLAGTVVEYEHIPDP